MVAMLFAGMLVNYVDRGNLSIAAVPMMREFGITPTAMGALLSAFLWTYALLQVPAGYLVDRFGLRSSMPSAFSLVSVSTAMGLANSFPQILALRSLLGVGESVSGPCSLSYIRKNFSEEQQGLPTAIYVAGMTLGPAAGALLGAWLLTGFGWRMLFILTGIGGLLWLVPWLLFAPSGVPDRKPRTAVPQDSPAPWRMLLGMPTFWGLRSERFSTPTILTSASPGCPLTW